MEDNALENKRMVIFDDDEDILSICEFVLTEAGWEVFTFPNCIDIINRVTQINPAVILMDNWIPEEGGIVATQLLKKTELTSAIPVIYFSANNKIGELAAEAGADDHISKPFELDALEEIVAKNAKTRMSKYS
jgi:CheY-like chemotaxis protein